LSGAARQASCTSAKTLAQSGYHTPPVPKSTSTLIALSGTGTPLVLALLMTDRKNAMSALRTCAWVAFTDATCLAVTVTNFEAR
jgi:hypothetical protein